MKKLIMTPVYAMAVYAAQAKADNAGTANIHYYIGFGVMILVLIVFLLALLVVQHAFKVMAAIVMEMQSSSDSAVANALKAIYDPAARKQKRIDKWLKIWSLKSMAEEKDILIEHDYDGIQELDNPTPAWFMWLFYATIAFAICYLLIYHVFGTGQLQYDEYKTEVAQADSAKKVYLAKAADMVDENTVKLVKDPAVLTAGSAVFKKTCVACHGEHAQGNVGPNLTDDYWIHGSKINDLFKTIKYGVAAKGMPTWEKQLSPKEISDVANYVKSLQGSNPANPKAPQGVKEPDPGTKTASN